MSVRAAIIAYQDAQMQRRIEAAAPPPPPDGLEHLGWITLDELLYEGVAGRGWRVLGGDFSAGYIVVEEIGDRSTRSSALDAPQTEVRK